jgi:hypothetical protein
MQDTRLESARRNELKRCVLVTESGARTAISESWIIDLPCTASGYVPSTPWPLTAVWASNTDTWVCTWVVSCNMQPSSLNAPGPTPLQAPLLNPLALGPNPSGSNVSMTTNGLNSRGSIAPSFPLPERHGTEPTVSSTPPITHPLRTIHSSPQISFPQPTFVSLGTHPAGSNVQQQQQTSATGKDKDKANLEALVYPDGEIPVSLGC